MLTRYCLRQSAERIFTDSILLISDWDLRGVHILPATQVVGLSPLEETIETARKGSVELDLVTHDVKKFFRSSCSGLMDTCSNSCYRRLWSIQPRSTRN